MKLLTQNEINCLKKSFLGVKMAINWYPIIDEDLCINCNTCVNFCQHDVFEEGEITPKVVNPENCIEFCRGCGKICPEEAISYFGDIQKKE
jgi:NAD-dependent dihydropyrimidine dehydrogenase PreA subunit